MRWRRGYGPRTLFRLNRTWYTFRSEHPLEERMIELTDAYRDDEGNFIPPEAVAWDGVNTFGGDDFLILDPDE
jgi:hypothetical protein